MYQGFWWIHRGKKFHAFLNGRMQPSACNQTFIFTTDQLIRTPDHSKFRSCIATCKNCERVIDAKK